MTSITNIFPRFCALLPIAGTGGEKEPDFAWSEPENIASLLALVTAVQNACARDLDALDELSLALYDDLGEQRGVVTEPPHVALLDFVQFWLAISPLANAAGRRRTSMGRDWAYRALVDGYQENQLDQTIHIERLVHFTDLPGGILVYEAIVAVLEYAQFLFYLGAVTGDLFDLTRALAPYLSDLVGRLLQTGLDQGHVFDPVLDAALRMLYWFDLYDEPRAEAFAPMLGRFEDDESNPESQRLRVALVLSGPPGRHTSLAPPERAQRCLGRYGDRLAGHERLGLLGSSYVGSAEQITAHLNDLLQAIDEYSDFLAEQSASAVDRLYDRGRLFRHYLGGLVRTLAVAGESGAACRLLSRWQGVDDVRQDVVLLLAADPDGTLWVWGDLVRAGSTDPASLGNLIPVANRALGLAITFTDAGEAGVPEAAERPGVPDAGAAGAYEEVCERHLGLHGLRDLVGAGATGGLVVIPGLPVPVCALASRATGMTWPIASSLRTPLRDRRVRRVVIWPTAVAGVDEEVDAVQALFGAASIDVEVVPDDSRVDHFRDVYARDDIDVLWLTCHGEQKLYRPEHSLLVLGEDQELSLEEILTFAAPRGAERRLLVLNACDSAAGTILGGPAEFGIGAAFAGPSQSVVGHMWSIPFTEAAGFGAVLAAGLAQGLSYRDGFGRALAALRAGADGLLAALEQAPIEGELRARLDRSTHRHTDILGWGSPTLFE